MRQQRKQTKGVFWDSVYHTEDFEVNVWQEIKCQKWKNYIQNISPYLLYCYLPQLSNIQMQIKCLNKQFHLRQLAYSMHSGGFGKMLFLVKRKIVPGEDNS